MRSNLRTLLLLVFASVAFSQDTRYPPKDQLIPAPDCLTLKGAWQGGYTACGPAAHDAWLNDIRHWRFERKIRIGYNDSRYAQPALQWIATSFIQTQMMVEDRYFYDPVAGTYTVDRYVDDLEKRYGGIDAVLIWQTYPNIGIDNRNQQDMIRCMPGGISGVRRMVADFHRRGVRVLFPMMMWDQGTRDIGDSFFTHSDGNSCSVYVLTNVCLLLPILRSEGLFAAATPELGSRFQSGRCSTQI